MEYFNSHLPQRKTYVINPKLLDFAKPIFPDGSTMQHQGYVKISSMGVAVATTIILKARRNVKKNVQVSRENLVN